MYIQPCYNTMSIRNLKDGSKTPWLCECYPNGRSGKRNRTVPISEELYHQIYKPTNDRLFTCSYNVVYKWLTIALPHLPEGQATHVLRHTFASHFMTNGGNILVLKEILGHQHIDHTMIYALFSPNHLSDAVRFNPLTALNV